MNAPAPPRRSDRPAPVRLAQSLSAALLTVGALSVGAVTGCSAEGLLGGASVTPEPSPPGTLEASPSPSVTTSAEVSPSITASAPTSSPASPGSTGTGSRPTPQVPGATASATCADPVPVRVNKVNASPPRFTEVVTVVSDGRSLTSGTRQQEEFTTPTLTSPSGAQTTDPALTGELVNLITKSSKIKVVPERPEPPDERADVSDRPFNAAGTYVLFNASSLLTVDFTALCGGTQERWTFTAEANPASGQINCAVEPPKSNPLVRVLYTNNC